jgi:hypothetical protein
MGQMRRTTKAGGGSMKAGRWVSASRGKQPDDLAENGRRLRIEFGVILVQQAILDRRNPGNVG